MRGASSATSRSAPPRTRLALRTAAQVTGRGLFPAASPDLVVAHVIRAITHRAVLAACRQVDALQETRPDRGWSKERVAAWHLVHIDPLDDAANAVDAAEEALAILQEDGDAAAFQGFFALVAIAARGQLKG